MMAIKPVRTRSDYRRARAFIEKNWGAPVGTELGDALDVLITLADAYEAARFPIDAPDPIAAIEFRMQQAGLTGKDLEPVLGSRSRVSEILGRKRRLTVDMIWRLHKSFGIPLECLSKPYTLGRVA